MRRNCLNGRGLYRRGSKVTFECVLLGGEKVKGYVSDYEEPERASCVKVVWREGAVADLYKCT